MDHVLIFWLFAIYTMNIQATTHWMVTERGLIQPRHESQYEMANPNDLVAFLNQDVGWDEIKRTSDIMSSKQIIINKYWSDLVRNTDTTTLMYRSENCMKAGTLNALDWYITHFEDGSKRNIEEAEFMLYNPAHGENTDVPDCKKMSPYVFSLPEFDKLKGVKNMGKLIYKPELTLPTQIAPIMTVKEFGHWVASVLRRNTTSWLHFTMASWYWRLKGDAASAMECSRRGIYFAPQHYKDIALLSMGSILYRSGMTEDAIKVFKAAVDHEPQYDINHFMLASAYAVHGDFNSSVRYFDRSLKVNPEFDQAKRYRYGALCHAFLLRRMNGNLKMVLKIRDELADFAQKEYYWLKTQLTFLKSMKHEEEFDYGNSDKICLKMTEMTGIDMMHLKAEADKNSFLQYYLGDVFIHDEWFQIKGVDTLDAINSLHKLIKHVDEHASTAWKYVAHKQYEKGADGPFIKKIEPPVLPLGVEKVSPTKILKITVMHDAESPKKAATSIKSSKKSSSSNKSPSQAEEDFINLNVGADLYPASINISRLFDEDFDNDPNWPPNELCEETTLSFTENVEAVFPTFLPFENKGIRLMYLLTDKINVPADVEHDLPWHPPTCPTDKDASGYSQRKSQKLAGGVVITGFLKQKLLEYVHNGDVELVQHMQDAEIGQRIYAAMKKNLAPKWLLYTLSSLYWRVRRNNVNALNCLLIASRTVKKRFRDIVLASQASVLLEMGYIDDAFSAARECFGLSLYEPASNFVLAELNMIEKHRSSQLYHLKQVMRVDPEFMGGLSRHLLYGWACKLKKSGYKLNKAETDVNVCSQVEPGVTLVCQKDGNNCHMADQPCDTKHSKGAGLSPHAERQLSDNGHVWGKPVSYTNKKLKVVNVMTVLPSTASIDESIFNAYRNNMPSDNADRQAHYENYGVMMRSANLGLRGCHKPCIEFPPEELGLKLADCQLQNVQLKFWLRAATSAHMLNEPYLRLKNEVPAVPIGQLATKIPQCEISIDPSKDYYVERMSGVDADGWQPLVSSIQEITEMFNLYDFVALGAKYSIYVDNNPSSWLAALGAGWWCGAAGRGACAVRCLAAAHALAPPDHAQQALRSLVALLYLQNKRSDAKVMAYLSFYKKPMNVEAFLVAVAHTAMEEYDQAVWFFRYSLKLDQKYAPSIACLQAALCIMIYREKAVDDTYFRPPTE